MEVVLQGLHESEIRCGILNEPPAGGISAWIDYGSRTEKAIYGTIVGDREVWPAEGGLLRAVSYQGQREDKPARQVVRPIPIGGG